MKVAWEVAGLWTGMGRGAARHLVDWMFSVATTTTGLGVILGLANKSRPADKDLVDSTTRSEMGYCCWLDWLVGSPRVQQINTST